MAYIFSNSSGAAGTFPAPMVPLGYQQIVSLVAATGLAPPTNAKFAVITVEAQAVRYRDDGTPPTAAVGMPVAAGATFTYQGDLSKITFIQQVLGGILNVVYYG